MKSAKEEGMRCLFAPLRAQYFGSEGRRRKAPKRGAKEGSEVKNGREKKGFKKKLGGEKMKKECLIIATIAVAVLTLAFSVPAMQSAFISEYQPVCPEESYNKITELYDEGWSEDAIAEELAFPLDIVNRYLEGEYIPPVCPEPSQEPKEKGVLKKPVTEEPAEQQQGNLPAEDSTVKFVTVEIPGYGRVTVPEDMVVREGDEITIVANSAPPITPIIEKLPETVWVTVETPYGPVSTSKETIERLGKERFIAEQTEFLEQLAELKKMERTVASDQGSNELADHG